MFKEEGKEKVRKGGEREGGMAQVSETYPQSAPKEMKARAYLGTNCIFPREKS